MKKLDKIKNILICPYTKNKLTLKKNFFYSKKTIRKYYIYKNKIFFNENKKKIQKIVGLKNFFKIYLGKYYYYFLKIFGPTYPYDIKKEIMKYINFENKNLRCLDLGSGNLSLSKNLINLDYHPYDEVNVVGDATKLPFQNNSLDLVISKSFLEHSKSPKTVVNEIHRVLKSQSYTIHSIPFMYPYHASPFDYNRYTEEGIKILFKKFKIIKIINITGPFTLFNLFLIEFVKSLLSIINKNLGTFVSLILMIILSPIKYLDLFFVNNYNFSNFSPNYLIVAKKN